MLVAIPDFQSCILPLLQLAGDGKERSLAESLSEKWSVW